MQPTNCPDWNALVRRRDEEPEFDQSEIWQEALQHFDSSCACRKEALHADPTLVFRRLPSHESSENEVDDMLRAVRTLRRASESERTSSSVASRRVGLRQIGFRRTGFQRTAVWRAGAMAAALMLFFGSLTWRAVSPTPTSTPDPALYAAVDLAETAPRFDASATDAESETLPLVEDVDPELGELIQLMDDEISIVLVISPADDAETADLNV